MMEAVSKQRIYSIDLLRGLVMIIMALDHTRDFFHYDSSLHDPLDPKTTTIFLFFTRFITHYCAPVFILLAGTSVYLQSLRKRLNELSAFLLKRGLWLIFIEITIINFAWSFVFGFHATVLQVIWAIGISFVFMSAIVRLPYYLILSLGLLVVFGHNVFDYVESTHHGFFWNLTRNGHFRAYAIDATHRIIIIYPFVPWLGLMMLGYCMGKLYAPSFDAIKRRKVLIATGAGLILFFILLRYLNFYGNPFQWSVQSTALQTVFSFMNVHKYPPSLLYMCITIGPALIFLSLFENANNKLSRIISVYGRVPFFYYVLHIFFIHILCMILFLSRGHSLNEHLSGRGVPFRFVNTGEGYSLMIVYVIWICIVIALYPLCKWFSDLKKRKNYWWLSYL